MGWDGPILTDSGGFQVFSLRDTISAVDDEGVTFRSVYDGTTARFTPELGRGASRRSSARTSRCASTSARPRASSADELEQAVRLTTDLGDAPARGAARGRPARLRDHPGRRRPRAARALDRGDRRARLRRLRARRALASASRGPRRCRRGRVGARRCCRRSGRATSWGSATRTGILDVIARGIDMFDCVLPTRIGRTGTALTSHGPPEPPERALRARPAAARRALRLPRVRALLARVHPPPRQPAGAPRAAAALAAQPALPARPDRGRARGDRGRATGNFTAEMLGRLIARGRRERRASSS